MTSQLECSATGVSRYIGKSPRRAESLHRDGIAARVIDVCAINPIDRELLVDAARDTTPTARRRWAACT